MVRLTRKERQDKVNLLASINKVNIGDEVEATDNGKCIQNVFSFVCICALRKLGRYK